MQGTRSPIRRHRGTAASRIALCGAALMLVLSGCGSGSGPSAGTFCRELRANGANGADFGLIQDLLPKEETLRDADEAVKAMGDAVPPTKIAQPWNEQKQYVLQVQAVARRLPDGAIMEEPVGDLNTLPQAEKMITDYWFAHCR